MDDWTCARCRQPIRDGAWHWVPLVKHPRLGDETARVFVQRVHSNYAECERAKEQRAKRDVPTCADCGQPIREGEQRQLEELGPGRLAVAFVHLHPEYCQKAAQRAAAD